MARTELILVRHGESTHNYSCDLAREGDRALLERQLRDEQDEAPWPLTELGYAQARLAAEWIRRNLGTEFAAAYVSPFVRARETADELRLPVEWTVDDRLRERFWGDYCAEGFAPYTVDAYLSDLAVCANFTWKTPFPGGESILDVVPRVQAFLLQTLAAHAGERTIAVTHGGTIRALQYVLEHVQPGDKLCRDHRLSNCCIVMYRLDIRDLARLDWDGEFRTAHPALPNAPQTDWQPIGELANRPS